MGSQNPERFMKERITKLKDFVTQDIWGLSHKDLSPKKSFVVKQLRIVLLAARKCGKDNVQLRASSLTFLSMLSVVPFVAMGFGIAKGFGFEKYLKTELTQYFKGQEKVLEWIMNFANAFLKNLEKTEGGLIAGVGVGFLLWTIIKVFGDIEDSFNAIWQVKQGRNWIRKFTDYISLMILAPLLFIIQSTTVVYMNYQIHSVVKSQYVAPVAMSLMKLAPFVIVWLLFALMYIVMPNTRVSLKEGMIAGIIAGTMFQILQWAYIRFQVGVSDYNAIYGSFAALPLFMIWLNWSWIIVLIGTEISYAIRHADKNDFFSDSAELSFKNRKLVALLICQHIIRHFAEGDKARKSSEIADTLNIPLSVTSDMLKYLTGCGVLSEVVTDDPAVYAYQPARDINSITIQSVAEMMENHGGYNLAPSSEVYDRLSQYQEAFCLSLRNLSENKLLKDVI